jgi:hypothetical protein
MLPIRYTDSESGERPGFSQFRHFQRPRSAGDISTEAIFECAIPPQTGFTAESGGSIA